MIYDIYNQKDIDFLLYVFQSMKLLEDDYLGGSGTRGSGQIEFRDISINVKEEKYYNTGNYDEDLTNINGDAISVEKILGKFDSIKQSLIPLV
ncbi:MAG: hypothetical protein BAJALOKI3v1_820001 [Promethearchaeota archaeon]|nr:MAG: hypothetical protein BAJALOKI3v1_820001 [Candidatus Lokiarchaeota archaeon]